MTPTTEQVEQWRATLARHPRRWCPTCGQPRCWVQAEAFAALVAHGLVAP